MKPVLPSLFVSLVLFARLNAAALSSDEQKIIARVAALRFECRSQPSLPSSISDVETEECISCWPFTRMQKLPSCSTKVMRAPFGVLVSARVTFGFMAMPSLGGGPTRVNHRGTKSQSSKELLLCVFVSLW